MQLALESPAQPEVEELIEALDAYQQTLYPPESHHRVSIATLSQPTVLFAVARDDQAVAIACGALLLKQGYGELKRMYVRPQQRGQGIGKSLLVFLEAQAFKAGCRRCMLETGILQPAALMLYERVGYQRCGPFGHYAPDPFSVFMYKQLG